MRKLNVRHRGGHSYEVGVGSPSQGENFQAVIVTANDKKKALAVGKAEWRALHAHKRQD